MRICLYLLMAVLILLTACTPKEKSGDDEGSTTETALTEDAGSTVSLDDQLQPSTNARSMGMDPSYSDDTMGDDEGSTWTCRLCGQKNTKGKRCSFCDM
jgi:hypothetical protein